MKRRGDRSLLFAPRAAVALLLVAVAGQWLGCGDAPRDNPLDPEAGRFVPVSGQVVTLFPPHRPLGGVEVACPAFGIVDTTDEQGSFTLRYLPPESLVIVAHGAGFQPCTLGVPPRGPARERMQVFMNALPRIVEASVTSTREERWWPEPYVEWITVRATVEDPDGVGDLDAVWCTVRDVRVALTPEGVPGRFRGTLDERVVSPFNAEAYVGIDFVCAASDRQGAASAPVALRLVRVVREVGTVTSPMGLEVVESTPTLRWVPPAPPYESALGVRVTRVDSGVEATAWESPLYPVTLDSVRVGIALPVGTYYWALYTVDSFGNVGRSREAAFRVGA